MSDCAMFASSLTHTIEFLLPVLDEVDGVIDVPEDVADHGRVWMRVASIKRHSEAVLVKVNGTANPYLNTDLLVIKLMGKIKFGRFAQPIAVPQSKAEYEPVVRDEYIIIGWGQSAGGSKIGNF